MTSLQLFSFLLAASLATDGNNLTFSTFAGNQLTSRDATGTNARFAYPSGVASDRAGNLYIADASNGTVRKISPGGAVTTLAGLAGHRTRVDGVGASARFAYPNGIAIDGQGNVYVSDTDVIRKITSRGVVTTLTAQSPIHPHGIAVDRAGNLYLAEALRHRILKMTPAGVVTTLAGREGVSGSDDGPGEVARFHYPYGIAVDRDGNVFVADFYNHTVRRIAPNGDVTTIAGKARYAGITDGPGPSARFGLPFGIALDNDGNVYVCDVHAVRKIDSSGLVTTIAGQVEILGVADGPGSIARFCLPRALTVDPAGNVFVADTFNHSIRRIDKQGEVSTFAGKTLRSYGHIDGLGMDAAFFSPSGVTVRDNHLYVADYVNHVIRKVTRDGLVTTFAGSGANLESWERTKDGAGAEATFDGPLGLAADANGNLLVADSLDHTIRKVTPAGVVSTLAGTSGAQGNADGLRGAARFATPMGVASDGSGNVYVADTGNHTIRRIDSSGLVTTYAGSPGGEGCEDGRGSEARFYSPNGLAADRDGNVYVADSGCRLIRKIDQSGLVTTLAGLAGQPGTVDGTGANARFNISSGIAVNTNGDLFVADREAHVIRKITPSGTVTTVAGTADSAGREEGSSAVARFSSPFSVAVDDGGVLYIGDSANHTIRKGSPGIEDRATIDFPLAPIGVERQLAASAGSAKSWQWEILRRPADSTAELSSTSIRNPTFTPDQRDLYVFQLTASDGVRTSITTVTLTGARAAMQPRSRSVGH